jgi:Flp pilus assembly protein TadD
MNAKKTPSRAMALAPCLLLLGAAAPFGVDAAIGAQVAGAAAHADPNLKWAIAEQRRVVESQNRPGDRATALNDLANLLELRGDVAAAFEHYRAAIAADGNWAPAHYNLALLAYTTGDTELASSHLQTAIELEPGNAWAHYQLGRVLDDSGEAEKAVRYYVRAVSLDSHLAFGDVNPHFAVNRYATEILLRADRKRARALPPRTYSEPGRISGLLVQAPAAPDAESAADEATETTETAESDHRRPDRLSGSRVPAGTETTGFEAAAPAPAPRPLSSLENRRASGPADLPRTADNAAEQESRVFTRDDLRRRTLSAGGVARVPAGTRPPSSSPASGRRGAIQVGRPVGPGGRQPEPQPSSFDGSRGGRFEPNSRSSAQLEVTIRRIPVPAP